MLKDLISPTSRIRGVVASYVSANQHRRSNSFQLLRGQTGKPTELYVDGGYASGEVLAEAAKDNRQIHGPIQAAPQRADRYRAEDFDVDIAATRHPLNFETAA